MDPDINWKAATAAVTFLTLSVCGLGTLAYFMFKSNDNDDKFDFLKSPGKSVVQVKIPKDSIGVVIGRGGNTIKEIETMSDTKLQIRDDDSSNDHKICYIKGTPEAVNYAESLIHEVLICQPLVETSEMYVPTKSCGRIMGKNGDNIRLICRDSNAKIIVDNIALTHQPSERKIIIKGTAEQIESAKKLLQEKIDEEMKYRKVIENHVSNRAPRNRTKYLLPAKMAPAETDNRNYKEKFMTTGSNGMLEVYVSAIESPDRMWVQVMGPSTVELDKLNEQMTEYYSKKENQKLHMLKDVKPGQVVAGRFKFDEKWYRAEVVKVLDDNDFEDPDVQLYYVDYGDTSLHKMCEIFELRTDFLRLRFQAIECMLAKIKPRDSKWSAEAIDCLGDLTHVALWKPLMVKVHSYKGKQKKGKKEGSQIPCIELYDNKGDKSIDVAEELVGKGFAVWEQKTETLPMFPSPDRTQKRKVLNWRPA